ncbi:YALIA101S09e01992g1_1 [Yarrowia lipolytica]|nr:Hypothetical protein YALI2_A00425g [Yarrowia lipolytica]SEI35927.1 YALIA101S09e01992g1_1 [Yarrowia lipolytica]VBB89383.1 Conserved hypothetical protein [Yarrowia lipolytica]
METPTRPHRVKVYELDSGQWVDKGTGYCTGETRGPSKQPYLVVQNEDCFGFILDTHVTGSIQYQKQQDTLIVWSESGRNDLALSFQEAKGCKIICDFLLSMIQKKYAPDISLVAVINTADGGEVHEPISVPLTMPPPPDLQNLLTVEECLTAAVVCASQSTRDQMIGFVIDHDYIGLLHPLLQQAEDQHLLQQLHHLCCAVKRLIQLNDSQILEQLLSDDHIMFTVGCLEYDPEYPRLKANHRQYLQNESRFKQVIPISNAAICDKIRQTFRIQFLKDVVLARLLDDQTFTILTNMIYFSQTEIIGWISGDENYLEALFGLFEHEDEDRDFTLDARNAANAPDTEEINFCSEDLNPHTGVDLQEPATEPDTPNRKNKRDEEDVDVNHEAETSPKKLKVEVSEVEVEGDLENSSPITPTLPQEFPTLPQPTLSYLTPKFLVSDEKRREAVRFIHTCCLTAKNLQTQQRSVLFGQFIKHGLFRLVAFALKDDSILIRSLGTELVVTLVDHDANLVRGIGQTAEMAAAAGGPGDTTPDVSMMDVTNIVEEAVDQPALHNILIDLLIAERDMGLRTQAVETLKALFDPETGERAETYIRQLYNGPMLRLFGPLVEESGSDFTLYEHLCDLLSFCSISHGFIARDFFIHNKIWVAMSRLVLVSNKQMQLAAIRSLKGALVGGDELVLSHLIENKVFGPILTLLVQLGNRNNLMHSACLDFLHIVRVGVTKPETRASMARVQAHLVDEYTLELQQLAYTGVATTLLEIPPPVPGSDDTEPNSPTQAKAQDSLRSRNCLVKNPTSSTTPKRRLVARTAEEQREAIEAVRRKNILEHQMREERERGAQGDREQGSEAPQTQEGVGEETQEGVTSSVEMAPAVGNLS